MVATGGVNLLFAVPTAVLSITITENAHTLHANLEKLQALGQVTLLSSLQ